VQIICYHTETAIILGIGNRAEDDLIDAVHQFDGAVWWHFASGVAVLT
jgi:hypothetical protein